MSKPKYLAGQRVKVVRDSVTPGCRHTHVGRTGFILKSVRMPAAWWEETGNEPPIEDQWLYEVDGRENPGVAYPYYYEQREIELIAEEEEVV